MLSILAYCLIMLHDKRKIEGALVADSPELVASVWAVAAFLPPGDQEPANAPRVFNVTLSDGVEAEIELRYDDKLKAWPSALNITWRPGDPGHADHRRLQTSPLFAQARLELVGPDGERSDGSAELADVISVMKQAAAELNAGRPKIGPLEWTEIRPGIEAATAYLGYGPRLGPRDIYLVRMDPDKYILKPFHEKEYQIPEREPEMDLKAWAKKLPQAEVLINSGQYNHDRSYIGLLSRDGQNLAGPKHRSWKGFLVSEPKRTAPAGAPKAAVLDMELKERRLEPEHYNNVVQSLMLLDSQGKPRVNNSFYLASRAAIGEDRQGRLWAIMCPGAISLHDLAQVLKEPSLDLVRVLCLDGGFEAQIIWRQADGRYFGSAAEYLVFPTETVYAPGIVKTLPSVIAAVPRE